MSTDWNESVTSSVSAQRGYRGVNNWVEFPVGERQDYRAALAVIVDERGRSGWVRVRCHGHDAGRYTRVRVELAGDRVRLAFDDRGGISTEVREITVESEAAGQYEDAENVERWRLTCAVCDRSAGRTCWAVLSLAVRSLLEHRAIVGEGRQHVARLSWWAST